MARGRNERKKGLLSFSKFLKVRSYGTPSDNFPISSIDLSRQRGILFFLGHAKILCQGRGERSNPGDRPIARCIDSTWRGEPRASVTALRLLISFVSRMNPPATRDSSKGPSFESYVRDCTNRREEKKEIERKRDGRVARRAYRSLTDRITSVGWQPIRRLSSAISSLHGPFIHERRALAIDRPFAIRRP